MALRGMERRRGVEWGERGGERCGVRRREEEGGEKGRNYN